jgi:hypothetical protein
MYQPSLNDPDSVEIVWAYGRPLTLRLQRKASSQDLDVHPGGAVEVALIIDVISAKSVPCVRKSLTTLPLMKRKIDLDSYSAEPLSALDYGAKQDPALTQ